jgi:hypothetical protein
VALQLRQALALVWVPQDDLAVIPAARENLAVERKGDRVDRSAVIFSNVRENTYVTAVYASPLNLRLSGGDQKKKLDRGKHATLGKMQSPVSLELLDLLARSHIPQPDAVVVLT